MCQRSLYVNGSFLFPLIVFKTMYHDFGHLVPYYYAVISCCLKNEDLVPLQSADDGGLTVNWAPGSNCNPCMYIATSMR